MVNRDADGSGGGQRLPEGTVTLLFSDIEGSTRLLAQLGDRYAGLLADHHRILRSAFLEHGGREVDAQGDGLFAVFRRAGDALAAAIAAQRSLADHAWPGGAAVRVRMALHTGEPVLDRGRYVGLDVHRAARLCAAAHGGQVLLSRTTHALVAESSPPGVAFRSLGGHSLRDLPAREPIHQLVIPGLPFEFPPLRTPGTQPRNLPFQPTPLIGRERHIRTVCEHLRSAGRRLVTLSGAGGIGKTRLAVAAAIELAGDFADGACFVALAPISDPALVVSTIARELGVQETGARPLLDGVIDHLRDKQLLLVLDNFEQVLAAAPLVVRLLAGADRLKILVTSRFVLRVQGEHDVVVPPLNYPGPGSPWPTGTRPADALMAFDAVRLFAERARASGADFSVTDENAPVVAEICQRLDGLPLALELAAARSRMLSPDALLDRLKRRLPVLAGGSRDLPERQRTLRDTVAWSYDLLTPPEQQLFRRLGTFVGGFDLEAVEAVCISRAGDAFADALEGLSALVDKHLVQRVDPERRESRFFLLETIREYAVERLERAGEALDLRSRHAEYYAAFAEQADARLHGSAQRARLDRLDADHDNFRAALAWSRSVDSALGTAIRLAAALSWFWLVRGHIAEARGWVEPLLGPARDSGSPMLARLLWCAGMFSWVQGDNERALVCYRESLALARASGDPLATAMAAGDLGLAMQRDGDFSGATRLLEEALALYRQLRLTWRVSWALRNLARVAADQGDLGRAAGLLDESLALAQQAEDERGIALCLNEMGSVACAMDQYERALPLLEQALGRLRDLGEKRGVGWALYLLGRASHAAGRSDQAQTLYLESLDLRGVLGERRGVAECLEGLGETAVAQDRLGEAASLFAAADGLREAVHAPLSENGLARRDISLRKLRSSLGEAAFAGAWASGRARDWRAVVADCLQGRR
jgi:predicted ATPase/class 3 adenylate cyclase